VVAENLPVKSSPRTRSRWTLIVVVPVVAGILLLFGDSYGYSLYPSSFPFTVSVFSVIPLATLEWFYAYSGRVQKRKLFLLFSIGIAATVGSAFHSTQLMAAGPCDPGVSGGGFPLPWYLTFVTYTGRGPLPPCPLFVDRPWGVFALSSFLFDTIFYAAFALAGNEFYRWGKVKHGSSQTSLS
jgi:hypothetical protein